MIFFQDELMQNWELAKDMKLGLYVSGFGIFMPKHLAGQWCVNSNESEPEKYSQNFRTAVPKYL